jgi:uncharacterized protein (TIGR02118 family)
MVKTLSILKRKPGLTPEEFLQYWKDKHAPLVARVIPGLRRYVQNHRLKIPGFECEIDGIAELWWDNLEALQSHLAWRQTEEAKVLIEDEKKFLDMSNRQRFYAVEYVVVEGEAK